MMPKPMTVGELKRKLSYQTNDDRPVVIQVTGGEYFKAYATQAQSVNDCLPDGEGGDDIHNPGVSFTIEAEI